MLARSPAGTTTSEMRIVESFHMRARGYEAIQNTNEREQKYFKILKHMPRTIALK